MPSRLQHQTSCPPPSRCALAPPQSGGKYCGLLPATCLWLTRRFLAAGTRAERHETRKKILKVYVRINIFILRSTVTVSWTSKKDQEHRKKKKNFPNSFKLKYNSLKEMIRFLTFYTLKVDFQNKIWTFIYTLIKKLT